MRTRCSTWLLGMVAMMLLQVGSAHATVQAPVPEISASSLSTGLAVLAGAVLILRSWRR